MYKVDSYITIGDYEFSYCVDVDIVNDINSLTDTCKIVLPRKFQWDMRNIALGDDPILKRKDKVTVQFGYDGALRTEFVGYLKNIRSGVPVVLDCEDSMMLLKTGSITHCFPTGTKLSNLLTYILPADVHFECNDMPIDMMRCNKVSPAQVLDELKKRYGLFSFFRLVKDEPKLFVGLPYTNVLAYRQEVPFAFGFDIIEQESNLVYKVKDDIRLKVKAIIIDGNNKRKEFEIGDEDGELRTLHYYKKSEATARLLAASDLERLKYTGYQGSFLSFGHRPVQKGDVVKLTGNQYHPDGKYLVKSIRKACGVSRGIKQEIEIGQQINDTATNTTTGR